ncbi:hypothetical protein Bbelb_213820 [Branchiostoma belcheri]|nr:hypothetical protein Bbelb_213820 [Branchiostoma belcheri]
MAETIAKTTNTKDRKSEKERVADIALSPPCVDQSERSPSTCHQGTICRVSFLMPEDKQQGITDDRILVYCQRLGRDPSYKELADWRQKTDREHPRCQDHKIRPRIAEASQF